MWLQLLNSVDNASENYCNKLDKVFFCFNGRIFMLFYMVWLVWFLIVMVLQLYKDVGEKSHVVQLH